jgi:hypothetical protein
VDETQMARERTCVSSLVGGRTLTTCTVHTCIGDGAIGDVPPPKATTTLRTAALHRTVRCTPSTSRVKEWANASDRQVPEAPAPPWMQSGVGTDHAGTSAHTRTSLEHSTESTSSPSSHSHSSSGNDTSAGVEGVVLVCRCRSLAYCRRGSRWTTYGRPMGLGLGLNRHWHWHWHWQTS